MMQEWSTALPTDKVGRRPARAREPLFVSARSAPRRKLQFSSWSRGHRRPRPDLIIDRQRGRPPGTNDPGWTRFSLANIEIAALCGNFAHSMKKIRAAQKAPGPWILVK